LTGTVAKVAAGALEHLHVSRVVNLNRALEELKKNGFLVVGLSGDGQLSISNFLEKAPLVVIVGSEDKGISLLTQKKCDYLLSIPLKGKTSSLNASVAAAISLFHLTSNWVYSFKRLYLNFSRILLFQYIYIINKYLLNFHYKIV